MIEAKKAQELERANQALQERNSKAEQRLRMLAVLSRVDYSARQKALRAIRHSGTGAWLTSHDLFCEWLAQDTSGAFSCFGIPGSGKSVLASAVVDILSPSYTQPAGALALAYHYCNYANHDTLQPAAIIGALAQQLLEKAPIPPDIEKILQGALNSNSPLTFPEAEEILISAIGAFSRVFILLDGVDELDSNAQQNIVLNILALAKLQPTTTKVLVMCRQEEWRIRNTLSAFPNLVISSSLNSGDIAKYVEETIEEKIQSKELAIGDPKLKDEIILALVNGAKDMYVLQVP
jgi:Cdc6-like AAA superfamily ATPase